MKASEVLMKAKALIGTPDKWCKGSYSNVSHTAFCSLGAISKANPVEEGDWQPATRFLATVVCGGAMVWGISNWNDVLGRTHAEVMDAFDRAIALALADERKETPWNIEDTRRVIAEITKMPVTA